MEYLSSTMQACCAFVEEHFTSFQVDSMALAVVIFDFNRPWTIIIVVFVTDVDD